MALKLLLAVFLATASTPIALAQEPTTQLAREQYERGHTQDAIHTIDSVIQRNPRDAVARQYKGIFVRRLAEQSGSKELYAAAIRSFEESLAIDGDATNRAITRGNIASTYYDMGDYRKAEPVYLECRRETGRVLFAVFAAQCRVHLGDSAQALDLVKDITVDEARDSDSPTNEGLTAYSLGVLYAQLRMAAKAVPWLRAAIELNRRRFHVQVLDDEELDPIRNTVEFHELLKFAR